MGWIDAGYLSEKCISGEITKLENTIAKKSVKINPCVAIFKRVKSMQKDLNNDNYYLSKSNAISTASCSAHPHQSSGGSSSQNSLCVSHLKISTLFAKALSLDPSNLVPFTQILNQITIVKSSKSK